MPRQATRGGLFGRQYVQPGPTDPCMCLARLEGLREVAPHHDPRLVAVVERDLLQFHTKFHAASGRAAKRS